MNWESLKDILFKWLKGKSVKLALKKILGSSVMGGVQAWVIAYIIEYLYDEYAVPMMNILINKGLFYYDSSQGKVTYKKLEDAKIKNDENSYNDISDNA